MTLVFSLPFCLLLPDGDYQVKLGKDETVTLNLTKVIPKIFDERLPFRGFLKGELENITELNITGRKEQGEWVSVDKLKQIIEMKHVIKYKTTKDKDPIIPVATPSIIERDVDIGQDVNINPETFAKSLGEELSPETINQMISERPKRGRTLYINAEVKKDPAGRFRYTKVRFNPNKDLHFEEQFKVAIKAVNILIPKYRRITRDFWITKIREDDVFIYKDVQDDSYDFPFVTKGIGQIWPDHDQTKVNNLRESLVADDGPGFPFSDLYLDAKNAFEQANYDLAIIYSVTALESIVKTYLVVYYRHESKETSDKVLRMPLNHLVTVILPLIFRDINYNKLLNEIIEAIGLRNRIIHESELGVSENKSPKVIEDVGKYMEFIQGKLIDFLKDKNI